MRYLGRDGSCAVRRSLHGEALLAVDGVVLACVSGRSFATYEVRPLGACPAKSRGAARATGYFGEQSRTVLVLKSDDRRRCVSWRRRQSGLTVLNSMGADATRGRTCSAAESIRRGTRLLVGLPLRRFGGLSNANRSNSCDASQSTRVGLDRRGLTRKRSVSLRCDVNAERDRGSFETHPSR